MTSLPPLPGRRPPARRAWTKRSTVALPLLCLMIFGAVIGSRLLGNATNSSAASLVPLKGNVPGLVKTSTLVGPTDPNQSISLSIGLKLRNAEALKAYAGSTIRSQSTHKPQHLTSAQITSAFAPLASSQQSVIDYMQGYAFTVTMTLSQHLVVGFKGTIGDAENAFYIQINNYQSSKGQTFYAPSTDPSVPANLAGLIQNVAGLDNAVHLTHAPITSSNSTKMNLRANATGASVTCIAAGTGYFIPSQIASAYDLKSLNNNGFNGEGQTIALLELDDYLSSDLSNYTSCYGGSQVPINKIRVDGGASLGAGAIEDELDIELILSAAPKLASLEVYEAPPTTAGELDDFSRMISDNTASVISTSWGKCEADMPSANLTAENNLFMIAAAQGQTVFAASGDSGTNACGNGKASVDDPASQPYVTGVGGTTLTLSGSSYGSETVWNDSYGAGGGGISSVWPLPSWQSGPGVSNSYSNGNREVPDVSLNADPATGYVMYCSVSTACKGHTWVAVGGTSAAAPLWAAFLAIANEYTLQNGGFNLGFINPLLYQVRQNLNSSRLLPGFHDVTSGNNDTLGDGLRKYPATTDYDQASGLGSFSGWNLILDLVTLASNMRGGGRFEAASTTWYFAEGSVGGQFTQYLTILNPMSGTAHVFTQYLFEDRPSVTWSYTVFGNTRFTRSVNDDLGIPASAPQQAISMIVTSDVPIVAERPMYFNRGADLSASGTDVLGATNATSTSFYFAAGDSSATSSDSTREFITILNPSSTATANITANFYSGGAVVDTESVSVPPLHRGTIEPSYQGQAAIQVTSDIGVVVERPIYYHGISVPTAGGTVTGAASTVGATTPGDDWLFAEGHAADQFQENLVLANFGTSATTATVNLEYTNGTVQSVPVTVNAESQLTFDVNNAYLHPLSGCGCTPTADVSIEVTSASPIVAERVMFFHYKGAISGVTDVVGEAGPSAHSTYSFAEGYTNNSFEEWLTLQNPNASSEVVAITLFFDGMVVEKEITLPAHSRTTLNINDIVVPIASVYPAPILYPTGNDGYNVSIDVQAFSGTVVVERPMYFNYLNEMPGGTDIIGYTRG